MKYNYVTVLFCSIVLVSHVDSVVSCCCDRDVSLEAIQASYEFYAKVYKHVATQYNDHFAISIYSIYFSLAALAEGATGIAQQELFEALYLPREECLRFKYYEVLKSHGLFTEDVSFKWKRVLAYDEGIQLNATWATDVLLRGLLDVLPVPLKSNPQIAAEKISKTIKWKWNIIDTDFSGNSVILDNFEYEGLWKTGFSEAQIERNAPFYNEFGVQTGTVDLMHITQKARFSVVKEWNVKVLTLPVGKDGEFTFVFVQNIGRNPIQEAVELVSTGNIATALGHIHKSHIPLRVAIPRFTMFSEHENVRHLLKPFGLNKLWIDPEASADISSPPALPSAYVQRVAIRVDTHGVEECESPEEKDSDETQSDIEDAAVIGPQFIANKPFLFALIHNSTKIPLFAGAFSRPRNNYLSQVNRS